MVGRIQSGWIVASLAAGMAVLGLAGVAGAQSTYPVSIFPPAPRELRQHLTRAQAAIGEERYSDAVHELSQVLSSTSSNDFFVGSVDSSDVQTSLKTEAMALLGSMPAKGRKFYELQVGSDAKQALEEALNAGDLAQLTEVGRRYFHTKAGYEATLLLGRIQLDQGRPLAAALTLKRVAEAPIAAEQYDPELSIMLATCWLYAGRPGQATETLVELKQRLPQVKVRLADKEVALFDRDQAALDWLKRIVGSSRSTFVPAAAEWVMYRGDERRNAESLGGLPLPNFNWKLPTVNDPPDEARVAQLYRAARDRGETVIPSLQPLVVQDYAILRQPESNKLIGINLKKNGKREWVFPAFDESFTAQSSRQTTQSSRGQSTSIREKELKQRIWEDHTFGQISSDGKQVYVIDDLGFAESPDLNPPRVNIVRGGRAVFNSSGAKPTNLLVALDLAKQGYQLWAAGGATVGEKTGDHPELVGAFFLGPPLPSGDQLYVLAEFERSGEIDLLCLSPRTGALEWKQQVAMISLEQLHIVNDRQRRLAGASPSLADGILVCPTSAGAVVAIDLATRTLRWGYQFERTDVKLAVQSRFGIAQAVPTTENGRWLDGTATIADGCVILTPVESQQLHCLDLLTGKAKWPAQARDDALFVGCIHEGKIILVGKDRVKAVKLSDGTTAWVRELKLEGDTTSGRGYYSDKYYYLPVTGQQLLKIDLDDGQVVAKAETEVELGNLVCYQNQLISQSPQAVTSFVLLSDQLRKQLEQRLAANGNDVEALAIKGQILLQEGNPSESLQLLKRANELAPGKSAVRGLLVKVMLALVRQDFEAHVGLTEDLDRLVTDPAQRREVLRWKVQGLARTKRTWEAFGALMELADQELAGGSDATSGELEAIDRELRVRPDRWLQGQLSTLWRAADADTQKRMAAELKSRQERTISSGGVGELRMFLNLFGFHEVSQPARLALADKLIASDSWLEAELLVGELLNATERSIRGAARATLALIYEKARRPELASREYKILAAEFGDVVCREGLTGQALFARSEANAALQAVTPPAWAFGQVEVKESDGAGGAERMMFSQRVSFAIPIAEFAGAAPRGLRATYDPQQNLISLRGEYGQLLSSASLRNNDRRYYFAGSNNGTLSGKANGHLVVVNLGAEMAAVDGLRAARGGEALLWRQDVLDFDPNVQRNIYPNQRTSNNPLAGTRYVSYDPNGKVNFNTPSVRSVGFCFQRGRQLICVDPLTGQMLWERSSVPQQADIFGDEQLLFITSTGGETQVLSAIDGTLLEKRTLDKADRRWATHGRRVLAWEQENSTAPIRVRLYDAWAQGEDLWSRRVPVGSRGCLIDGDELALLEPNGQFTVVSLATGAVRFAETLKPEASLAWIQVIRSDSQYLLMVSQQESNEPVAGVLVQPLGTAGIQQTRLHGRVYAFDRVTGKAQWPAPAFVAQHCLPGDQPSESPLLIFVRNRTDTNRPSATTKASVLVLDRRDGRMVHDSDDCGMQATACDLLAEPLKQLVTLTLYAQTQKTLTFHLTDKPTPPAPPAQTGPFASDSAARPPGSLDRTVNAAIELLQRGLMPPPRPPGLPQSGAVPPPAR